MTLAVGFNCPDKILIATDTQIVVPGVSKVDGSKLFPAQPANGVNTIIATAGNMAYSRMAMQHLEQRFGDLKADLTIKNIRNVIENEIVQMHTIHIYPHPDRSYGNVGFDLLIGVWSPADKKAAIYFTSDTAVDQLFGYACIGSGNYLAHNIIRPQYKFGMSESEVRPLATLALERAKSYVDFRRVY